MQKRSTQKDIQSTKEKDKANTRKEEIIITNIDANMAIEASEYRCMV